MARWTFVRHAQSVSNAERWCSGHRDVPLTAAGVAQAVEVARTLAGEHFDQAFCSDLQRAAVTAQHIVAEHPSLPLQATSALRERDLGDWTGEPIDTVFGAGGTGVLFSVDGRPPGGESLRDVAGRVVPWLLTLPDAAHTLIVAHGGTIRVLLGLLDGMPWEEVAANTVPNATPLVREATASDWQAVLARVRDGA